MRTFPFVLPVLPTARLELRAISTDDIDALFSIFSDPQTLRYWSRGPYSSPTELQSYFDKTEQSFIDKSQLRWGLARREDGRVIGVCSLYAIDAGNLRADIGYILHKDAWGRGYMREALTAIFDYAFEVMSLRRIEADIDPRNAASITVLEKLGFQREGLLKERWLVEGEVCDSLMMGLLRSAWPPVAA
ncbi:MAG: GNAT family protein [Pseudomonadota bacterium]